MEETLSLTPLNAELSLPLEEVEEETITKVDPLSSDYPVWSSRFKCFQAYLCVITNFVTAIRLAKSLGEFGLVLAVPFILFRLFVGLPAALLEIFLGRYVMGNVVKTWQMCSFGTGILYCSLGLLLFAIISNDLFLIYTLKYLVSVIHGGIPWKKCSKPWAKINCFEYSDNSTTLLNCLKRNSYEFCNSLNWESSGLQYWKYINGSSNSVSDIFLSFLFLSLTTVIIVFINYKGVRSCEKMLLTFLVVPLILACTIALASFLISEAVDGLKILLFLDFNLLRKPNVWIAGFEGTLTSLNLGLLVLNCISTHGNFLDDILIDLALVLVADVFSFILFAIPITSIAANIKHSAGKTTAPFFSDYTEVFVLMSEALLVYPEPSVLWAILFYLEMFLVVFGVQVIMFLTISDVLVGLSKKLLNFFYVDCILGMITFVLTTPFLFFEFSFFYIDGTLIFVLLFLYTITIIFFYGMQKINDDFHFMMGYPPCFIFRTFWILTSLVVPIFLILQMRFLIPRKPFKQVVFVYAGIPIFFYLVANGIEIIKAFRQGKITAAFVAKPEWGPENEILKKSREVFDARGVTKEFMYRQDLQKKAFMRPVDFSEQNIVQLI